MTRAKQPKHGIWFDFIQHIQIHRNVLSGWASSMSVPQTYSEVISDSILKLEVVFKFAHNNYEIHVSKFGKVTFKTDSSGYQTPHQVMTTKFTYMAFNQDKDHSIRLCSPHEKKYNPNLPWHCKTHRHEKEGANETITVFAHDDRPILDKLIKKYYSGKKPVDVIYTLEEWPHLSEFFSEIFKLS